MWSFRSTRWFGRLAQLGERTVRIDMDAHRPTTAGPKFRREITPKLTKTENFKNPLFVLKNGQKAVIWARSSAGRAPGSQSGSRGFDPLRVHHFKKNHRQFGGDFSFDHNNTTDGNHFWPLCANTGGELKMITACVFVYLWLWHSNWWPESWQ